MVTFLLWKLCQTRMNMAFMLLILQSLYVSPISISRAWWWTHFNIHYLLIASVVHSTSRGRQVYIIWTWLHPYFIRLCTCGAASSLPPFRRATYHWFPLKRRGCWICSQMALTQQLFNNHRCDTRQMGSMTTSLSPLWKRPPSSHVTL